MISVNAHWIVLNLMTLIVAFTNSVYLIKMINFCATCSRSDYINNSAKKDVKGMAIAFLVFGILVGIALFISKFNAYSKFGFASKSNAKSFAGIYVALLYVAITYNIFAFMNFAAIASRCKSDACSRKSNYNEIFDGWRSIKNLNVIYICIGVSYILFRFTCPRQRYGVPSEATCKRVLCLNKVRNKVELAEFNKQVKKVEDMNEPDQSRKIRILKEKIPLKRENGDKVRGDQLGFYDDVLHQVRTCASVANEKIELMGFKSGTWGQNCSGFSKKDKSGKSSSSSSSSDREKEKKQKEREKVREKEMLEIYREQRKKKMQREKEREREKSKKSETK